MADIGCLGNKPKRYVNRFSIKGSKSSKKQFKLTFDDGILYSIETLGEIEIGKCY